MGELRFDGRVAIVTGAGGGLGRSHALLLANRGCKVLVNDAGARRAGEGRSGAQAATVVGEIRAAGGIAEASTDSVEDGARIVEAALAAFGRVDIVVNNAGILHDASFPFHALSPEDWELVDRVHVLGAMRVTQAAWPHLRERGFGRVLFTTSAAGLYGSSGRASNAAALALVGLAKAFAIEGRSKNIHVNAVATLAGSRVAESHLPRELAQELEPELISPLAAWLCHESCPETGSVFEAGGGWIGQVRWQRAGGKSFPARAGQTPETVRDAASEIGDFSTPSYPVDLESAMAPLVANAIAPKRRGNDLIDVDQALGHELPETETSYTERDVSLYALGVGAGAAKGDLRFVYENHPAFAPLPTFAVVPVLNVVMANELEGRRAPGLTFGLERVLHSEQLTELMRPWPSRATLKHAVRVKAIYDQTKYAIVVTEARTFDASSGQELARNELTMTVRGAGGWGGERAPVTGANAPPVRAADAVVEQKTREDQALLYRLSGDVNPLHVDPELAEVFGLAKPILHGLCTYGFAARHVLDALCGGEVRAVRRIRAKFAAVAYPGETLVTEMWRESASRIVFQCRAKERDKVVLANAVMELAGDEASGTDELASRPAPRTP